MTLRPGTRVGPYQVVAAIGSGGMGEVYRARDSRLQRDVALKVLPEAFARDPERLPRFQREAEALAALNHPSIAAIYGLEEVDGGRALVLELVEGPTLADRIARGPIGLDDALPIATQIAEALEAAHERGIVHRDLKPANIKLRPDGVAKVLDFGIAKAMAGAEGTDAPHAPTATFSGTREGAVLGTPAYMSPEQARGQRVDQRADIWAFGCVVFEMLSGRQAFQGRSVSDTLAAVVRDDPDWGALPADVPSAIRRLLRRCLDRDPRRRLRDMGDARIEIQDAAAGDAEGGAEPAWPKRAGRRRELALGLGLVALAGLVVGGGVWLATRPDAPRVIRLSIVTPADAPLSGTGLAISPDGTRIIYASGDGTQLSVRAIDELMPKHLTGLGSPLQPFVSPDGQWIGFFDGLNALKKIPMTGGPAVTVCSLGGTAPRGAAWSSDGTIIFATDDPATALWRVPETGGTPELLTGKPEGGDHHWPHVLPGGRAVLFTVGSRGGLSSGPQVAVLDLDSGVQKLLLPGSHALYVRTGHLLYAASGALRAIRFDLARLDVVGTSVPVMETLAIDRRSVLGVSVGTDGTLAYIHGGVPNASRSLVWLDRQGKEEPVGAPPGGYVIPRISPDGTKVALDTRAGGANIWIWDVPRRTMTRFTFGSEVYPVWSRDGRRLAFTSFDPVTRAGNLFWRPADGATSPERLAESSRSRYASSFTRDGTRLLFREEAGPTGLDIGMLALGRDRRIEMLIQTPFNELNPEISPDGQWLAYESNESGRSEIYVRPFPDIRSGLSQISTEGGAQPAWAPSGQELFYVAPDGALMRVAIERKPSFAAGTPARVVPRTYFTGGPFRAYDVSPDGNRFLMITTGEGSGEAVNIVVVLNWFEELKQLAPRQ